MDDVAIGLKRLGLTQYQSSALSVILSNEGCSAVIVSDKGNIPITKVYSVLQSLEYMGFVRANLERPKKYSSVGIENIFNSLVDKQKQALVQLRKEAKKTMRIVNQNIAIASA